ncbi:MAG TPA: hypothetical protein PLU22_08980 [Polyangiaceae bacterium]|nr:hypothetical protein [Polyangiaceae bacterium]
MAEERLIDTSELPLERELLRAAAEESPPPSARRRGLAALGLLSVAVPTAAAAAPTPAAGFGASWGSTALGGWSGIAKWGLVAVLGGAGAGGAVALDRATRSEAVAPAAAPSTPEVAPPAPARAPPGPVPAVTEAPAPAASAPAVAPARPRPAAPPRDAAGAASIRDEIDRLDRARGALSRGAPDTALAVLAEYAARHPRGELREEAAVLRIEALRARGDQRAAAEAAERFGERFPSSAHQDRVQGATR